jgi:hypothetical protein
MQITKKQLKQIIKEELAAVLGETSEFVDVPPVPDKIKQGYLKWEENELGYMLNYLRAGQVGQHNSNIISDPSSPMTRSFQDLIRWASTNNHPARADLLAYRNAADKNASLAAQGKKVGDEWVIGPIEHITNSLGITYEDRKKRT